MRPRGHSGLWLVRHCKSLISDHWDARGVAPLLHPVSAMSRAACHALCLTMVALAAAVPSGWATLPIDGDHPIRQFLAQDDTVPAYVAERRLEAEAAGRTGWILALTTYSQQKGFNYDVTAEGGSGLIRGRLLRALLDGERDAIAKGEAARASIALDNYEFKPGAIDAGLATVELTPRRKERVLVAGTMTLRASDGDLVCLRGRLAKSPSLWVKNVEIVRHYERIGGTILPVAMESMAQLRPFGTAALHMTYRYLEVNGRSLE